MSLIRRISDLFKKQKPIRMEGRVEDEETTIQEGELTMDDLLEEKKVNDLLSKYKKETTLL